MDWLILPFILVSVLSYPTRDCWDRYPVEWAYFRDVYTRMYNTNSGLDDLMSCMEWKYAKLGLMEAISYGSFHLDVCQLCTDYRECLEGRGNLHIERETNPRTIHKTCWRICKDVKKLYIGQEEAGDRKTNLSTSPELRAEDQIRDHICSPAYLYINNSQNRGRGLYTMVDIPEDSYVVYYNGRWSDEYPQVEETYTFEIKLDSGIVWIDASYEDGSYGRLMNDNHLDPNVHLEILYVDEEVHIAFFASRDIEAGEELTFDYGGEHSKYWWRNAETEEGETEDEEVEEEVEELDDEEVKRVETLNKYMHVWNNDVDFEEWT